MNTKYDDIKDITWYTDKTTPKYGNRFYLYIGKPTKGESFLRLKIEYSGNDWLFIESFIVKTDNKTYNISPEYNEIERDNGSGTVWEWYDTTVNDINKNYNNIVKDVANSKTAKIRYNGKQYHKDRIITDKEKQALKNVLDAYEALSNE